MKTLFLDCSMGAAGDMLTAALFELLSDDERSSFINSVNSLGIPGVRVQAKRVKKCGITGTHMEVLIDGHEEHEHDHHEHDHHDHGHHDHHEHDHHEHGHDDHHHAHSSLADISEQINALDIDEKVKEDAQSVYRLIAGAESAVHDTDITQIHFHEVGTKDALADVLSVCMLMKMISPDRVVVSPVCTGGGSVKCAHGILPVPAPATAFILKDVPMYQGQITSELCTPTGAALVKYFADGFSDMPVMKVDAIGYGMGTKDFEKANTLRAFLGQTGEDDASGADETVRVLQCNVDDMTGEEAGFAIERLLEEGAYEAFSIPVNMKKSRPGLLIEVICSTEDTERMCALLFRLTTTIGIRQFDYKRYVLDRRIVERETKEGTVRIKESFGYGTERCKYEYEDLARIARKKGIGLREAAKLLEEDG